VPAVVLADHLDDLAVPSVCVQLGGFDDDVVADLGLHGSSGARPDWAGNAGDLRRCSRRPETHGAPVRPLTVGLSRPPPPTIDHFLGSW
jgi:hypothetical protein